MANEFQKLGSSNYSNTSPLTPIFCSYIAYLSIRYVEGFCQLSKVFIDVYILKSPAIGSQPLVQGNGVTLQSTDTLFSNHKKENISQSLMSTIPLFTSSQAALKYTSMPLPLLTEIDNCQANIFPQMLPNHKKELTLLFFQLEMHGGIFHSCCSFTVTCK